MEELITIIIPVYNVEKYLNRCIQSVLNQTYKNLEIIMVDDGSTDSSPEICDKYEKRDSRIKVIHQSNGGLSDARNSGLEISKGEYVLFIDSDDYVGTEMIENFYKCLVDTGADTVIGGFRRSVRNKIEIKENTFAGKIYDTEYDIKNNVLKKMLASDGQDQIEMSVWKVLFSMDIIRKNHLRFPERKYLCEDIIFDFDYYPLCKKVAMCNDTSYYYCFNGESLSQAYQKDRFDRLSFQANEMKKRAKKISLDNNAYLRIDNFYIGNSIHHIKTMVANRKKIKRSSCIQEIRRICNTKQVQKVKWSQIKNCFVGRDRIPFLLMKKRKIYSIYFYLVILTNIRRLIR